MRETKRINNAVADETKFLLKRARFSKVCDETSSFEQRANDHHRWVNNDERNDHPSTGIEKNGVSENDGSERAVDQPRADNDGNDGNDASEDQPSMGIEENDASERAADQPRADNDENDAYERDDQPSMGNNEIDASERDESTGKHENGTLPDRHGRVFYPRADAYSMFYSLYEARSQADRYIQNILPCVFVQHISDKSLAISSLIRYKVPASNDPTACYALTYDDVCSMSTEEIGDIGNNSIALDYWKKRSTFDTLLKPLIDQWVRYEENLFSLVPRDQDGENPDLNGEGEYDRDTENLDPNVENLNRDVENLVRNVENLNRDVDELDLGWEEIQRDMANIDRDLAAIGRDIENERDMAIIDWELENLARDVGNAADGHESDDYEDEGFVDDDIDSVRM